MNTHPELTKKNLQKLYVKQGLTAEATAQELGASKNGVINALHRFDLPVRDGRGNPNPALKKETLRRLYIKKKLSIEEISGKLGTSRAGVYSALKRFGIKTRSQSKAARLRGGFEHFNWKKLAKKYVAGTPLDEIAKEAGCCWSTASGYLKKHTKMRPRGAQTNRPNSRGRIEINTDKAIRMNQGGATLTEISEKMGVSVQVVSKRLRDVDYQVLVHKASKDEFKNYQVKKREVAHAIGADRCVICPESRGVQLCHILAKRFGGKLVSENAVALCPSHHFFFDHKLLNRREQSKLSPYLVEAAAAGYEHHHYTM